MDIIITLIPAHIFLSFGYLLSYFVMAEEKLHLPGDHDGNIWMLEPGSSGLSRTHRHRELEFNLVVSGTARYLVTDQRVTIRRRVLLWLFPGQEHVLLDMSPEFSMWIAVIKPERVRSLASTSRGPTLNAFDPGRVLVSRLSEQAYSHLGQLCGTTRNSFDRDTVLGNAALTHALLSAWHDHLAADSLEDASDVHPAVERAALILRDEHELTDLETLSKRCGLSPSRLSRLFKQQTGVSLVDFRNRRRIERFLDLYGSGRKYTMIEAALRSGFGSYPQFHRVFRQIVGRSPADYRRQQHLSIN